MHHIVLLYNWNRATVTVEFCKQCESLQWRHNERDGISNHQPHDYLLNRLFRSRWKKTSKLRVTGLCGGIHRGPVNSPHKGTVTRKMFLFDDVIMWNIMFHWCPQHYLGDSKYAVIISCCEHNYWWFETENQRWIRLKPLIWSSPFGNWNQVTNKVIIQSIISKIPMIDSTTQSLGWDVVSFVSSKSEKLYFVHYCNI